MKGSGAQKPSGHSARSSWRSLGTRSPGTQCAPPQMGSQAVKREGSITGGPVHGQARTSGGSLGSSQPMSQGPVGVLGSPDVGSKQGTQRSLAAQLSRGRKASLERTSGRLVERQRPSAPATERQLAGGAWPAEAISLSGVQKPVAQVSSMA